MNTPPTVPQPYLRSVDVPLRGAKSTSEWVNNMQTLAARYNDSQVCLNKLDELLASGKYTANQMRRLEEDSVRCYGLFITALVRSYIGDRGE